MLFGHVEGKDSGVFQLENKGDLILDLALRVDLEDRLVGVALDRIGADVNVDAHGGGLFLHLGKDHGRARGLERQVFRVLGIDDDRLFRRRVV